jgi:fructan beta-fructosidase
MKYLRLISSLTAVLSSLNPITANATDLNHQYRPQFHFTPKKNWMNDPNGLVYLNGEYHLFFQYNPEGTTWGHMSWGHAVSKDLVHWSELPVAIPEDEKYSIFSGSAVVDKNNTAGFGKDAIVAIYTSAARDENIQSQSIAFSIDGGRTFTKYAGNPVIDLRMEHFRDPKVFWDEKRNRWAMVLVKSVEHKVSIYSSTDLKNWTHESDFGPAGNSSGIWECPDLFELPIDGKNAWVLLLSFNPGGLYGGSGAQYFVGDFDGKTFTPKYETKKVNWLDYGADNYAAVTYNNAPNNRRILIGWMSNWQYASGLKSTPWTGAMTVPHEISLVNKNNEIFLSHQPIKEIDSLRNSKPFTLKNQKILNEFKLTKVRGNQLDITMTIHPGNSNNSGIRVLQSKDEQTEIGYDSKTKSIYINRGATSISETNADLGGIQSFPVQLKDGKISIRILIDRSSVEVFTSDGLGVITDLAMPDSPKAIGASLFAIGGSASVTDFKAFTLKTTLK